MVEVSKTKDSAKVVKTAKTNTATNSKASNADAKKKVTKTAVTKVDVVKKEKEQTVGKKSATKATQVAAEKLKKVPKTEKSPAKVVETKEDSKSKKAAKAPKVGKTTVASTTTQVSKVQAKPAAVSSEVKAGSLGKDAPKKESKAPSPLQNSITEALKELRTNPKLSMAMKRRLPLVKVLEVDTNGTKSVVIYIKAYILNAMKRVLPILKPELESKLGKQVFFVGYRRIIQKPVKRSAEAKVHRAHRRTVTGVHESILNDLIYPSEVMGKRTLYRPNGVKVTKIFLDEKFKNDLEKRLKSLSDVYKRLAGRDYKFEFPAQVCPMRYMLAVA